jgi:hypothetical protein
MVMVVCAATAHAQVVDTSGEPRIAATVLTLGKPGRGARLLVQRSEVTQARAEKRCPVHITLATTHPQFRTIELDFAYVAEAAKKVPLQVVATTPRSGDAAARGSVQLSFKTQDGGLKRLVAKVDARIAHLGAQWQLRGTVEVANTACPLDAK